MQVIPEIPVKARWAQNPVTVVGGNGRANATNQLAYSRGLFADDYQTSVIADIWNHRIVQWMKDDMNGQVVAGGRPYWWRHPSKGLWVGKVTLSRNFATAGDRGRGDRLDQWKYPTDVLIDKETDSLIISDYENGRVVRWSRQSGTTQGEILINYIFCIGLAMDDQRNLYVSRPDAVRRYQIGDKQGTHIAGDIGQGSGLNQLKESRYVFVDRQQTVYVPDCFNHRAMKWNKGATEGIVVAEVHGNGNALNQLAFPNGLLVDTLDILYVTEFRNDRVMRWPKGARQHSKKKVSHKTSTKQFKKKVL
ncbi:unnamed protein product [Rotaria magnacalcarata]